MPTRGSVTIRHFSTEELALEVGGGESGVRVFAWLPPMFSRAKIRAHSPGSYPDRFDYFGQEWPRHQSDVGRLATHSRFSIRLWAIREGMVKSAVQPESSVPNPYKGCMHNFRFDRMVFPHCSRFSMASPSSPLREGPY